MKAEELRFKNWVHYISPSNNRVVGLGDFTATEELAPIPLTDSILANNGWSLKSGIWVYKGSVRLGWKDGKLYVGYAEWPKPIRFVHELQNVMYDAGLEEESINFKI